MAKTTRILTVRMPARLVEALDDLAMKKGRTRSDMLRRLLHAALRQRRITVRGRDGETTPAKGA